LARPEAFTRGGSARPSCQKPEVAAALISTGFHRANVGLSVAFLRVAPDRKRAGGGGAAAKRGRFRPIVWESVNDFGVRRKKRVLRLYHKSR
jgi:hypothetical protein